jgi:elongation factor 1-beta
MASTVVVIVKIMPKSPDTDLEEIKSSVKEKLESEGGKNITFEEKEIAFGLKAIMLKMAFPEEKGTDTIEETISKIPQVSSVSIEDYRRAFG